MFPPQCSCCSASSVFCSIALRLLFCSPLSAGCSASPLCFLLFPPQVLDLVSRSSRKDSAETLLCLAERASLLRVCTVLMLCEATGRGLEICVTVSDLVLPHLCVCVCACLVCEICLCSLSYFVHAHVCLFCFACLCHLLVCMRSSPGRTQRKVSPPVPRLEAGTERRTGRTNPPPRPRPPTPSTQVRYAPVMFTHLHGHCM